MLKHTGVLTRSKISESLLHGLSLPWHGLPGSHRAPEHRDQRRSPLKFSSPAAGAYQSGSILLLLSNPRLSILLFRFSLLLLERNLQAKQFSQISLKLKQTHVKEACVCWSSLNDPRVWR